MFSSILVPLDRSVLAESVLPHARAAAHAFGAGITLLTVLDAASHRSTGRPVEPLEWQLEHAQAEHYLASIAQRLQLDDRDNPDRVLDIRQVILEGAPAESIVQFANNFNHALIVLSSHGQNGLTRWNVSSVTYKVALRASASLLVVRASSGASEFPSITRYRRIVLPLDGSQRAECVLPVATQISEWHAAEIVLVHVVRRPELPRRMPVSPEDLALVDALIERNQAESEAYFGDLQVRLPVRSRSHILVAQHDVCTTLQTIVSRELADLVIISAHGYSGQVTWPFGSVARSMLEYGTTNVLIVQDNLMVSSSPVQGVAVPRARTPLQP